MVLRRFSILFAILICISIGWATISAQSPAERILVPSDYPLTFDLVDPNNYRIYPIFGSATLADSDMTWHLSVSTPSQSDAPADAANGVYIGTTERRIYLAYQQGGWKLIYGEGDTYPISRELPGLTEPNAQLTLRLTQQNRYVTVVLPDNQQVQVDFGKSLFAADTIIYLFAQTAPASVTTVHSASIEQAPNAAYDAILAQGTPLRDLADARDITFGIFPDADSFGTVLDWQVTARHANLIVMHLGWSFSDTLDPLENNFSELRSGTRLAHARANGQRIRVHPLLWYFDIPDWVTNGHFSSAQLEEILRDRVTSLMTKHRADEWVVVNEALADPGSIENNNNGFWDNIFYRTFGEQYIDRAFRLARTADPNAILLYNDYGVETINAKSDAMLGLLQRMLDRGTPIDGVGLQFHLLGCEGTTPPSKEQLLANMARFADLGLEIYITELDVNLNGVSGTQEEKWELQAQAYQDVTAACLETAACKSVTTWGARDASSWWYTNKSDCGDDPLFLDDDYSPKPAFFAIEDALRNGAPPDSGESAQVQQTNVAPTIDGDIDEPWNEALAYSLDNLLIGSAVPASDLAASYRTLYDADNLYFLVDVTDDSLHNDSGEQWWEDDAVEIYLDGNNSNGSAYDGVNDYQLVFRWDESTVIAGPNSLAPPAGLNYRMITTASGYRLEVALPLSSLDITATNGYKFGLDVQVIDDDDGRLRETKLAWHATVDEAWQNPSLFGTAVLVEEPETMDAIRLEAEAHDAQQGIETFADTIGFVDDGDWVRFDNVELQSGYATLRVHYAKGNSNDTQLEVRIGSPTGTLLARLATHNTGGWDSYIEETTPLLLDVRGPQTLYFVFHGGNGVGNFDKFIFEEPNTDSTTSVLYLPVILSKSIEKSQLLLTAEDYIFPPNRTDLFE